MKNLFTALLMFIICTSVNASLISIGFETIEGYPNSLSEGGSRTLENHGWYCNTLGTWQVPFTSVSTFAHTGQRSAQCTAMKTSFHWASYSAAFTPSIVQTMVTYSAAIAFQPYPNANTTFAYAGIGLVGKKADLSEVEFGGLRIWGNGNVDFWGMTSGTSSYTFILNRWNGLEMRANFESDTLQFYVDGNYAGSLAFDSSIESLTSISLHNGSSDSWSVAEVRYDTISANIPEPMTLAMLGLGSLIFVRKQK